MGWQQLFGKEFQRKQALKKLAADNLMHAFLTAGLVSKKQPLKDLEIVSLDLETTGLDPKKDEILSYGLVEMRGLSICLESAKHQLIRTQQEIPPESAVIHGITDDQAASGLPIQEVLPTLLQRLQGKVMLVHYANIEQNFINNACQQLYGAPFIIPTIDTLLLAQRLFERRNHTIQSGDLRLFNLRPRFNLPNYQAHNALSDALGTAELFLAIAHEMAAKPAECKLGQFLRA